MIANPELVDVVCCALPRGRRNAVTIADLARQLALPKRDVEEALQAIAMRGQVPLCAATSKPAGVWLGSEAEVRAYVAQLGARIGHQRARLDGLQAYLLNLPEPQLWDLAVAS
ncbi:MAG TPA: hypothetical protein VK600_01365 [Candidatus Saccharimonadales bacterium]|nr:hypothetical protein [Candidatus Saccharimonadales bacterium]